MRPRRQRRRIFPWKVIAYVQRDGTFTTRLTEVWGADEADARIEIRRTLGREYRSHTITNVEFQHPTTFVVYLIEPRLNAAGV